MHTIVSDYLLKPLQSFDVKFKPKNKEMKRTIEIGLGHPEFGSSQLAS
jgi:hypothetical protein